VSRDILDLPAPSADARLAYGPEPLQFGELRLPTGASPHPVLVVIHGGFWRARYGLDHIGHLCAALTAAGLATWNVEYRRVGDPGGGWPGTFHDVAAAAEHVRALAPAYGLDLGRVVALGHSAGGHLALWLAGRHRIAPSDPLAAAAPLPLRGAVSLGGVVDLRRAWERRLGNGAVDDLLGGPPDQVAERYAAADPAALLPLGVRQVLVHGTADANVPFALSEGYAAAAVARGDAARLVPLPGAGHFEVIDPRSREWPAVEEAVLELVR
jgi:acetyl esterase/lipase